MFSDQSHKRFDYIDALRGIAILMVLVGHCAQAVPIQAWLRTFTNGGLMGVYLFFVISAYTIFYMLSRHTEKETRPVRNFFIRRVFRVAPLYWAAIIYYTVVWQWLPPDRPWHFWMHIFFLHSLHPETQTSAVPGGWSVSIEMLFYLLVPLLFSRIRSLSRACSFTLLSMFVLPPVVWWISDRVNPYFSMMDPYGVLVYWERFPLISLGNFSFGIMLFYLLKNERITQFVRHKAVNISGLFLIGIIFSILPFFKGICPLKSHLYSCLFMCLILLLAVHPWKVFVNHFTVFMGRISYSFYLIHFAVANWLVELIPRQFPHLPEHWYSYFAVYVLLSLLFTAPAAWLTYRMIEQPFIELSKRLIVHLESGMVSRSSAWQNGSSSSLNPAEE